jgi:hypothetical protein
LSGWETFYRWLKWKAKEGLHWKAGVTVPGHVPGAQ